MHSNKYERLNYFGLFNSKFYPRLQYFEIPILWWMFSSGGALESMRWLLTVWGFIRTFYNPLQLELNFNFYFQEKLPAVECCQAITRTEGKSEKKLLKFGHSRQEWECELEWWIWMTEIKCSIEETIINNTHVSINNFIQFIVIFIFHYRLRFLQQRSSYFIIILFCD